MSNYYGNSVAGALGSDVGMSTVELSDFESGCAGKAMYANIDHTECSSDSEHTFATVIAVVGEDGGPPNTNVDIVVGVAVVVSYVYKVTPPIDADGSHKDPSDKDLSTLNSMSDEANETSHGGEADKGTTFKSCVVADVSVGGAPCVYTTNGIMLYLSSSESSIDVGAGIATYLIEMVHEPDMYLYLSLMPVVCSIENSDEAEKS